MLVYLKQTHKQENETCHRNVQVSSGKIFLQTHICDIWAHNLLILTIKILTIRIYIFNQAIVKVVPNFNLYYLAVEIVFVSNRMLA